MYFAHSLLYIYMLVAAAVQGLYFIGVECNCVFVVQTDASDVALLGHAYQ